MNHLRLFTLLGALLLAAGCATDGLPRGARVVGGGLKINWVPPGEGSILLVDKATRKIVATESVNANGSAFEFDGLDDKAKEVLEAALGSSYTNAQLLLYFVPAPVPKP